MKVRKLLFFSVLLVLLTGALGLKAKADCDDDVKYPGISAKIQCYHAAAITAAYLGDIGYAETICEDIWLQFGENLQNDRYKDIRKKADLVSNTCYYDIAKIARNSTICDNVRDRQSYSTKLFGGGVSQESCINETERLEKIAPWNYYKSEDPDNICAFMYVLPLLVFSVLMLREGRP